MREAEDAVKDGEGWLNLDELYMQCMALVQDLQKNYHLPYPRTMGERIPLARQQSGAEKYIKYMTDLF